MRNLKNPSNRNFKHVIVYVHKKFGALKKFCEGCRSKMLIFAFWARSRAIAREWRAKRENHAAKAEKKLIRGDYND